MIVYNRTSLDNLAIRNEAQDATDHEYITGEENAKIRAAYPVNFYTPNIFICAGLFLLTALIAGCTLGLFLLIDSGANESFATLLIFFGLLCYGALEYVVYKKRHFRSGVDYALFWLSAGLLYTGFFFAVNNMSVTAQCLTVITISILFTLRFSNNIMALVAYGTFLFLIIHIASESGRTVQLLMPFIMMAVSFAIWFPAVKLHHRHRCRHYRHCLMVMMVAALVTFYLAGNYFVVRELRGYMMGVSPNDEGIYMGWLFWTLTVITPLFYIYYGVRKKNSLFLWTGLALIAAIVFTVRYYYNIMPVEWALILGGFLMIAIAYGLIRYLKTPKFGFTSQDNSPGHLSENLYLESLLIAETFGEPEAAKTPNKGFQFGGGSGGGGGAGGNY